MRLTQCSPEKVARCELGLPRHVQVTFSTCGKWNIYLFRNKNEYFICLQTWRHICEHQIEKTSLKSFLLLCLRESLVWSPWTWRLVVFKSWRGWTFSNLKSTQAPSTFPNLFKTEMVKRLNHWKFNNDLTANTTNGSRKDEQKSLFCWITVE